MRLLVMSDTHGNLPLVFEAACNAEPFDLLIHLGDGEGDVALLKSAGTTNCIDVAGNCDIGSSAPRELIWEIEGKRLLLTHGDAYGVKQGYDRLRQHALEMGVDAALFGHTHLATVETHGDLLLINPGTLAKPAGYHSYAIVEVTSSGIRVEHHQL